MSAGRIAVALLAVAFAAGAWGMTALVAAQADDGGPATTDVRRADVAEIPAPPEEDDMGDGDDDRLKAADSVSDGDTASRSRASRDDSRASRDTNSSAGTTSAGGTNPNTNSRDSASDAGRPGGFRISAQQLLINQRISQAALRRVAELEARLEGRPYNRGDSGDSNDSRDSVSVSSRQLLVNQRIAQAAVRRVNALQARVEGRPAPQAGGGSGGTVRLTPAQLRINQRISQAAVRRANALDSRIP